MVSSHIGSVLKQALTTFTQKSEMFHQNLEILKSLLEKTTPEDINLDPQFRSEALWQRPNKAPVTYIEIYEDVEVTLGVFALKPNMKLPLHNHPNMHGLIKVLYGKVKITSFSLNTDKTSRIEGRAASSVKFVTAERVEDVIMDETSECCQLGPENRNLHEIESVEGPAAFIDILAPPYETTYNQIVRKCSYFRILREIAPGVFRLQEVEPPRWYWTDSFPYLGPELH